MVLIIKIDECCIFFQSEWGSDLYTPVDTCVLSEVIIIAGKFWIG